MAAKSKAIHHVSSLIRRRAGKTRSSTTMEDVGEIESLTPPSTADVNKRRESSRLFIVLSLLAVIVLLAVMMFFYSPQQDASDIAKTIIAALLGSLGTAIGFYFTRDK